MMQYDNVSIAGLAVVDAPIRVTSDELGERLKPTLEKFGLTTDFIRSLTGIVARRMWPPEASFDEVAALAAEEAIADAGVDRGKIGVVINTSVCKEFLEPSTACLVQGRLNLSPECRNFDIGNACLAFIDAMDVIANMIDRRQIDYGLVVDGEGSRYTVERTMERLCDPDCDLETFRDNFATLTLGSGAAAMVLARSDLAPEGHRLKQAVMLSATQHNHLCRGTIEGMVTDASTLLVAGVELADATWRKACEEMGWSYDYLDEMIIHQVSEANTKALCKQLEIASDKMYLSYPEYGNVGPAAVPITLAKSLAAGRIQKGSKVALMGIGSGLNCTMMEVEW